MSTECVEETEFGQLIITLSRDWEPTLSDFKFSGIQMS